PAFAECLGRNVYGLAQVLLHSVEVASRRGRRDFVQLQPNFRLSFLRLIFLELLRSMVKYEGLVVQAARGGPFIEKPLRLGSGEISPLLGVDFLQSLDGVSTPV